MKVIVLAVLLFLSGCTSLSPKGMLIKEADDKMSSEQGCKFLGQVHGTGSKWVIGISNRINNAKNEALEIAADLDATHIIWGEPVMHWTDTVYITGRAYKCSNNP